MKFGTINVWKSISRREKAIALVTVVSMVAIMTIFILALFSMSKTEQVSARNNAETERAREYGDTAINLVMGQIWEATKHQGPVYLWASQPGAIRKYTDAGAFVKGYKLYSSSTMQVVGAESAMNNDVAPATWATQPANYADLNEPVVKPALAGSGGAPQLYFPIIDPRAYIRSLEPTAAIPNSPNVEGFWYSNGFSGVSDPANLADSGARLPMPVQWLYILKDGTLGSMATGSFVPALGGSNPSATNPITARVAFWTDDESAKININTASEPTHWATPTFYHRRDQSWANSQPTAFEYQRFPGHPATIALSTVLFPNQEMDSYKLARDPAQSTAFNALRDRKERIYQIAPKINSGGSQAGSLPYWRFTDSDVDGNGTVDNANNQLKMVDISTSIKERLYASVDELLFSEQVSQTGRILNDQEAGESSIFSDVQHLDRSRFFLTAHSRMPELNLFGLPRVAIWPVAANDLGSSYRTGYDQLIAYCSTLGSPTGSNQYYFQRKNPRSKTEDITIPRNEALLTYLESLMTRTYPGGSSLATKYPEDHKQILVEIFDYIRSTNLYDGFLAPTKTVTANRNGPYATEGVPNGAGEKHNEGQYYRKRDSLTTVKTFTPDRMSRNRTESSQVESKTERLLDKSYPGHGQVIPSEYEGTYRGFGRFVTLTEIGFHFICTADGNPDKGSYRVRNDNGTVPNWPGFAAAVADPKISGGRTAVRIAPEAYLGGLGRAKAEYVNWIGGQRRVVQSQDLIDQPTGLKTGQWDVWYSNYPPFPGPNMYGTTPATQANHPGYDGRNWNVTLPINRPLNPGQRRVQMMFQMEFTTPSAGNTKLHPDFSIVVEGADGYQLDGQDLFQQGAAGRLIWKSGFETMDQDSCRGTGGSFTMAAMSANRSAKAPGPRVSADPDYDISANASGDPHRGVRNFDLLSNFVTVNGGQMTFTRKPGGEPLKVLIYAGHEITGANLVQTINIPNPGRDVIIPTPALVTLSSDNETWQDSVGNLDRQKVYDAPAWWAFNYGGAIGRFTRAGGTANPKANNTELGDPNAWGARTLGRLAGWGNIATDRLSRSAIPRGGAATYGFDSTNGNFNNGLLNPLNPAIDSAGDAFSDTGLVDMNDNETGARTQGVGPGLPYSRDIRGTDVLFTFVPAHSDVRHLMAKSVVLESDWVLHPKINNLNGNGQFFAHNLARFDTNAETGFDPGTAKLKLVPDAVYNGAKRPDLPADSNLIQPINLAKRYGDFDNGPGMLRDGAWINKPDEGNTPVNYRQIRNGEIERVAVAYLDENWYQGAGEDPGATFMTPNRMVSSPGVFGSLPTGVKVGDPWKTLLFRPHTVREGAGTTGHPGGASHMGGISPADHYFMDLFWMPVVEPYAISEPLSTAGKINLNYQMVPFNTYIRRATGIHAVMKGELLSCVGKVHAPHYKNAPVNGAGQAIMEQQGDDYYARGAWRDSIGSSPGDSDYASANTVRFWHRNILVEKRPNPNAATVQGTLTQFEDRFNFLDPASQGLFRTASQICEVHLIPDKVSPPGGSAAAQGADTNVNTPYTKTNMASFWSQGVNFPKDLTGDNTRERPYANIYAKITTQSNTYRVHFRAQAIRKARSTMPDEFDVDADTVSGDYRGSALIERFINLSATDLPNFAPTAGGNLDSHYRFRVLELKRFNP